MMQPSFEPAPKWLGGEDRCCRACGERTSYALMALECHHAFPCCGKERCRGIVAQKMAESAAAAARNSLLQITCNKENAKSMAHPARSF